MNLQQNICDKIFDQQPDFFMGSLHVDFLFANTPLEEVIEIYTNKTNKNLKT